MRSLASAGIVFTLLLTLASPAWATGDDMVLLKSGGRVRGTVVVEDPGKGVRIRLADGTIRDIPASEVQSVVYESAPAPAAPPPAVAPPGVPPVVLQVAPPAAAPATTGVGSIHVETTVPATIVVDGGMVGKAPTDVKAAAAGKHHVRADFDQGGSKEEIVLVQADQTVSVTLATPERHEVFASRQGLHAGLSLELTYIPTQPGSAGSAGGFETGGAGVAFVVDDGLSPALDFRATVFVDAAGGSFAFFPIGASAGFRFNLGSLYTMGLGARGGVGIVAGKNSATPGPFVGPEFSLIGFRFGDRSQYSIELAERIGFYFFSNVPANYSNLGSVVMTFENALTFTYLFGGSGGAAAPTNPKSAMTRLDDEGR